MTEVSLMLVWTFVWWRLMGIRTGDRQLIKELNTSIVLTCLRDKGPLSRTELAEITGLGRSTISGIVARLLQARLVRPIGSGKSSGGRRPEMLSLDPTYYNAIGIKLQADAVFACRTDLEGRILSRQTLSLESNTCEEVIEAIVRAYEGVREAFPSKRILGVGLALPGLVDPAAGVSVEPHYFGWHDLPLAELLADRLGRPVWLDNDSRVGALGEKWIGVGRDHASFLFITLGLGVGGCVILDGRPVRGDLLGAGHIGHIFVSEEDLRCHCGGRGCLDAAANDAALVRYMQEESRQNGLGAEGLWAGGGDTERPVSSHRGPFSERERAINDPHSRKARAELAAKRDRILEMARRGHPAAQRAVDRACRYVAIGVDCVVKLLGLSCIVVGGEAMTSGGEYLRSRLHRAVLERAFPRVRREISVLSSGLGNDVWLLGAAALVLESAFRLPTETGAGKCGGQPLSAKAAADLGKG